MTIEEKIIPVFDGGEGEEPTPPAEGEEPTPPAEGEEPTPPAEGEEPTPPAEDWKTSLSDDLRNSDLVKGSETLEGLLKNILAPTDPTSYELPSHLDNDEVRTALSASGLKPDKLGDVLKVVNDMEVSAKNAQAQLDKQGLDDLYDSWGEKKDKKISLAKQLVSQFDNKNKDLAKLLQTTGAGNNPVVIEFFGNLGSLLEEDGFLKLTTQTKGSGKSAADRLFPSHGKS